MHGVTGKDAIESAMKKASRSSCVRTIQGRVLFDWRGIHATTIHSGFALLKTGLKSRRGSMSRTTAHSRQARNMQSP
jgi:hypothetical protein